MIVTVFKVERDLVDRSTVPQSMFDTALAEEDVWRA